MGAYLLFLMGTYVVEGIRTVWQEGVDQRRGLVLGLSFSVGIALETSSIIDLLPGSQWLSFLNNGLTAGTLVALLMTWTTEFTGSRPRRLEVPINDSTLPRVELFLRGVADRTGWNDQSAARLCAAGEETLLSLFPSGVEDTAESRRNLTVVARPGNGTVELEFFMSAEGQNIQDRLAFLGDETPQEDEASFRLLRHYAESVRHQKFNGMDVVRVSVSSGVRPPADGA